MLTKLMEPRSFCPGRSSSPQTSTFVEQYSGLETYNNGTMGIKALRPDELVPSKWKISPRAFSVNISRVTGVEPKEQGQT
jgi:hypothetical protein